MTKEHRAIDFFSGTLSKRRREHFDRHLNECVHCQQELKQLRTLDASLALGLRSALPSQELPAGWLSTLEERLQSSRGPRSQIPGRMVALAAAVFVAMLVVLLPLGDPEQPEEYLNMAYAETIEESFLGRFALLDGDATIVTGTFARSKHGHWTIHTEGDARPRIEEIQIGQQVWRRAGGQWSLSRGPLQPLKVGNVVLSAIPDLLETIPDLTEVHASAGNRIVGKAPKRLNRASQGTAAPVDGVVPDAGIQDVVVVTADGKIVEVRINIRHSGHHSAVLTLDFEQYGIPVQVEPPDIRLR